MERRFAGCTPGVAIYVDDLPGEEQPFHQFGFHGFGVDLPHLDPPEVTIASSMGRKALGSPGRLDEGMQRPWRCSLVILVNLSPRRDARQLHHHRDHLPGQEGIQGVGEVPVAVFLKVPQQPCIQLLGG